MDEMKGIQGVWEGEKRDTGVLGPVKGGSLDPLTRVLCMDEIQRGASTKDSL